MSMLGKLLNPMGGSSDVRTSTQATSTTTTNTATDNRVIADGGGIGISGDGVSLALTSYNTDSGAIAGARDVASWALAAARDMGAGAIAAGRDISLVGLSENATNVAHLLDTADKLFSSNTKLVDLNAGLASALASKATGTEDTGVRTATPVDQKTMLMLGGIVLLGVVLIYGRGR